MKTITYIVFAYLLVAVTYLLFFKHDAVGITNNYKKDSTVVYITDSTIYHPKIDQRTINNPTQQFFYYGSDTNACDSIRKYQPTAENDSIRLEANILVHGKLIDAGITYKWKRPILTIKTIREPYPVDRYKSGIFIGGGLNYKKYYVSQCPVEKNLSFSGLFGYQNRAGWMIQYSYNTNNIHSLGICIFTSKFKKHL